MHCITNSSNKLTLCGNTLIEGSVFAPNKQIERGYIEGRGFSGDKLVNGNVNPSEHHLPKLHTGINELYESFKQKKIENSITSSYEDFVSEADFKVKNSFKNKTIILFSEQSIYIENVTLLGNVIIISKGDVQVSKSSDIQDIIVFAKNIEVESGFAGSFQAFSSVSIEINENCHLRYPTVLCCNGEEKLNITLGAESKIVGDIILSSSEFANQSKVLLDKGSLVHGVVYSNNNVELKGVVHGSVYCNGVDLNTKSSKYQGYLLDCEINTSKLSEYYVSSNIFSISKVGDGIKELQ